MHKNQNFPETIPQNFTNQINSRDRQILAAAELRSGFSWRSPFGSVFQLPFLAIFLIAVFAPEDVLQNYSLAASFASSVRGALLSIFDLADIQRFADSTDYPQVALLVCALHWVWLPISALIYIFMFEYFRYREGYVFWKFSRGGNGNIQLKDLKRAAGGWIFIVAVIVMTMTPVEWPIMPGITTKDRLGMGLILWIGFWLSMLTLGINYACIRIFFDLNLKMK